MSRRGRIGREAFLLGSLLVLTSALSARLAPEIIGFERLSGGVGLLALWGLLSLAVKRAHDLEHGGRWLLWLVVRGARRAVREGVAAVAAGSRAT